MMKHTSFATLLAIIPTVLSQSTISVDVGPSASFIFSPPMVTANVGDTVLFTFHPKNHTVTQSSFNEPCVPLGGGFDTDFNQFVANDSVSPLPQYPVVVKGPEPIWVFCRQTGHCGQGMVFAINPGPEGSNNSFSEFQANAERINGTSSAAVPPATSPPATSTAANSYQTPPPESWAVVTTTVTDVWETSTWVTTYSSEYGSPAPTFSPSGPQNHIIQVGLNGGLNFTPPTLSANILDTVTFVFNPKNHSVTQSTFENPCVPKPGGFNSGFNPVNLTIDDTPKNITITIQDMNPIWGFCQQTNPVNHCQTGPMIFAINAQDNSPWNWTGFQAQAKQSALSVTNSSGSGSGSGSSGSGSGSSGGGGNTKGNSAQALIGLPTLSAAILGGVAVLASLL